MLRRLGGLVEKEMSWGEYRLGGMQRFEHTGLEYGVLFVLGKLVILSMAFTR